MKTEEEMILDNRPLIYKMIKDLHIKYRNEDEFQEYYDAGLDGLIKGVRSYDVTKGKISTWCVPCIRNEMLHLMTTKNYKKNKNEFGDNLYLYSVIPGSDDLELIDTIEDSRIDIENDLEKKFESERLLAAVNQLKNEKDKLVVKMYYGLEDYESGTYESVSKYLGVTRQAIQARLNRAKKSLKQYLEKNEYIY